jgi:hypothetical protein
MITTIISMGFGFVLLYRMAKRVMRVLSVVRGLARRAYRLAIPTGIITFALVQRYITDANGPLASYWWVVVVVVSITAVWTIAQEIECLNYQAERRRRNVTTHDDDYQEYGEDGIEYVDAA